MIIKIFELNLHTSTFRVSWNLQKKMGEKDPSLRFSPLPNFCSDSYIKKFICHFDNLDSCTSCPHNSVDCHYVLCHPASQTSPSYLQLLWITTSCVIRQILRISFLQTWAVTVRVRVNLRSSSGGWSDSAWTTGKSKIQCLHSSKMLSEQNKQFLNKNTIWNVKAHFPRSR